MKQVNRPNDIRETVRMGWAKTSEIWVGRLGAVVTCLLLTSTTRAQDCRVCCSCCWALTLESLARMNPCQLECLYRQAEPGSIPVGYLPGRPIYLPDTFLCKTRSKT